MLNVITFRRVVSLVSPGALLLFVVWAIQQDESVREASIQYAAFISFGTLGAAALLSWYHNYARVFLPTAIVGLVMWTFGSPDSDPIKLWIALLLPLNFILTAALKERGLMTLDGAFQGGILLVQLLLVHFLGQNAPGVFHPFLQWGQNSIPWTWLPLSGLVSFAVGMVFLLVLVCRRRTSVEAGLLWALAGVFMAMHQVGQPEAQYLYGSAVGLLLTFAVLENGFDMAYRDELTGLPGRRAFNELLQKLSRRYTIAMCDVDNFKTFNDTYGHEAGDQILKTVATTLFGVKGGGRAFRYGGEEFALVFNGRSAEEVQPFVESMRDAIAKMGLVLNGRAHPLDTTTRKKVTPGPATSVNITISIGVADNSGHNDKPEVVLEAADAALYRAKESGRNCVKFVESVSV